MHLIDRTGLFKISNLVLDGKEIVTSLCSSLEGQRQRQTEEPVGREQGWKQRYLSDSRWRYSS